MGGVGTSDRPRRWTAALLAALVALGSWLPHVAVAAAGVPRVLTHQTSSKNTCACPLCPGERQCWCEHGQAPSGSTCSAASDEPSGTVASAKLPTPVGKLILSSVAPVEPPLRLAFEFDSNLVHRSYPYPAPPDKVPIDL